MRVLATYETAPIPAQTKCPEFPLPRKCPNFRKRCQQNLLAPNALFRLAARAAPPPLRPRPCIIGQLPDRKLPTSSPKTENCLSYEAGLAVNCHQLVPARDGSTEGQTECSKA